MIIKLNYSIKKLSSFSMNVYSKYVININNICNLFKYYNFFNKNNIPIIFIGNGTNTIFLKNFIGVIFINNIKGIYIEENNNFWFIKSFSGENLNNLILYTIKKKIFGLENLSNIPGKIGASPLLNIGAYGLEIKNVCEYVDILNLKNEKIIKFYNKKCRFKYRNSYLNKLSNNYFILLICLKLKKKWKPILNYSSIKKLNHKLNSLNIYKLIKKIRNKKLPNYKKIGNCGSFFKNPLISKSKLNFIKLKYDNIPYIRVSKYKFKLYSAWLIDKCDLKNFRIGNVSIYNKNPLVIINLGSINNDIIFLIKFIVYKILIEFNIKLLLEVSIYSDKKKINLYC